jgi:hypothetical protein
MLSKWSDTALGYLFIVCGLLMAVGAGTTVYAIVHAVRLVTK